MSTTTKARRGYIEKLVRVNRVAKTVKGGRTTFTARLWLVMVHKGVLAGRGKVTKCLAAIQKARKLLVAT